MSFQILLVQPRGFCAGVERAIDIVDLCLQRFGTPLYVRREIVHNRAVVDRFRERGVIFVEELHEVPSGSVVVFSAHGVAPEVFAQARERDLEVIDATCPLVTKVHLELRRNVEQGGTVVLIGHAGHDEVLGTMGQAPERTLLVQTEDDVASLDVPEGEALSYVTQTTLSVDECRGIIDTLRARFPHIQGPARDDICYATQNRQDAVKHLVQAEAIDLLLVVGSQNSSNSKRLVEVALQAGVSGQLIDSADDLREEWLEGVSRVGVSAGASAPEDLVIDLVEALQKRGGERRDTVVATEDVVFALPSQLRGPVSQ
ncbi:4-hydroxy-3-methylbut-2-enyl diphosphate reductase [bacterium]|nr:MAG: 4-hydroxy-3-methylbut-2-enyl diphosphate reductase [bacterium]